MVKISGKYGEKVVKHRKPRRKIDILLDMTA